MSQVLFWNSHHHPTLSQLPLQTLSSGCDTRRNLCHQESQTPTLVTAKNIGHLALVLLIPGCSGHLWQVCSSPPVPREEGCLHPLEGQEAEGECTAQFGLTGDWVYVLPSFLELVPFPSGFSSQSEHLHHDLTMITVSFPTHTLCLQQVTRGEALAAVAAFTVQT